MDNEKVDDYIESKLDPKTRELMQQLVQDDYIRMAFNEKTIMKSVQNISEALKSVNQFKGYNGADYEIIRVLMAVRQAMKMLANSLSRSHETTKQMLKTIQEIQTNGKPQLH